MVSYAGKHADYYDIIYGEKPYADEARFVDAQLKQFSEGKIETLLELACGTGRHAFELEKLGYRIVATDYSEDLLRVALNNANVSGSTIDFRLQDMRTLSLDEGSFDAAYCLFDSIGYVQTNEAIRDVLESVHRHVRCSGLFVLEFWHAAAMLRGFEPRRERRWKTADGELIRVSTTKLDVSKQLAEVSYFIEEHGPNGKVHQLHETQINRYFLVQEMANFLEGAGFEPLTFLNAYQNETPIDSDTWHILSVARRLG